MTQPPAAPGPRVLLIEGALRDNGGLRVSLDLARRWQDLGARVRFLVLEDVEPDGPMLAPDPALDTRWGSDRVRRFRSAAPRVVASTLRHARRADVVVSGSEVGYGVLIGWAAARLARKPFVVLVQSSLPRAVAAWTPARLRPLLTQVHQRVDAAVCVSPGLVPDVLEVGVPAERVHSVDVGIDVAATLARVSATGGPVRSTSGRTRLVAAGRLTAQKGFDVLLDALARVVSAGGDVELVLVGAGEDEADLRSRADLLGVADRVDFAGHVGNLQNLLAGADLFVLSSRYEGNGSLVLLEALAHGTPVVATDCPTGPRHVLRDGEVGDLVAPEDPAALAGAVLDFLADPGPLRRKALRGPARAWDFDQDQAAVASARVLASLLS
ncbi:glycosyltransferase [Kineococcus aurantiacus]|uniref:Glycosyltransferase involved in cell wall biosynthesis n=1 Tax=Kineococcus aurantiacus TaxID=37633 RepID=A0A7Y9AUJ7_9ACTN|nr:glycosyltransferase [Kineococcus aurantiacus]NYD21683.1 glycosyltransferase involved in cell wall biosynthesis [Kineococcus aurantiacus]